MATAHKTFVAGDVLTAADTNTYLRGGLELAYAEITSNSSAFTTVADITSLSVTWTAISSRVYLLTFDGLVASSVAGDVITVYITDSSNNQKVGRGVYCATASGQYAATASVRLTGLSGSVTYKVRAQRTSGTGTTTVQAAATSPAYLQVIDVGYA